jgi:hypothetical protein
MRAKLILLAVCGGLSVARAGAGELREILSVRSVGELESRTRESSARKLAQDTCAAELAARLLPRACFRELEGLAAVAHDRARTDRAPATRVRRLTRVCIENAKASHSRLDLSGPSEALPPDCRRAVAERLEDFQYIDEAKSPRAIEEARAHVDGL